MLVILCAETEEALNIDCPRALNVITGVGVCNVIKTIRNFKETDRIINIGYAGSNKYPIGSVIGVKQVKRLNYSKIVNEPTIDLTYCWQSDICYTADDFIENPEHEIPLVDMELYYLAVRYPQIESIKIVSDNLNYSEYKKADFSKSWELVNKILNNL